MDRSPPGVINEIGSSSSATQTELLERGQIGQEPPVLRLQLQRPKNDKKVVWHSETVDNENMGKKKSKCCCIYKKSHSFGESSSEDEDECENCFGHVEQRKKKHDNPEYIPKPDPPRNDDSKAE